MVEFTLPNIVTVGLISIGAIALFKWGAGYAGIDTTWL